MLACTHPTACLPGWALTGVRATRPVVINAAHLQHGQAGRRAGACCSTATKPSRRTANAAAHGTWHPAAAAAPPHAERAGRSASTCRAHWPQAATCGTHWLQRLRMYSACICRRRTLEVMLATRLGPPRPPSSPWRRHCCTTSSGPTALVTKQCSMSCSHRTKGVQRNAARERAGWWRGSTGEAAAGSTASQRWPLSPPAWSAHPGPSTHPPPPRCSPAAAGEAGSTGMCGGQRRCKHLTAAADGSARQPGRQARQLCLTSRCGAVAFTSAAHFSMLSGEAASSCVTTSRPWLPACSLRRSSAAAGSRALAITVLPLSSSWRTSCAGVGQVGRGGQ